MGKLLDIYLSNFITRYDKDGIIPYLSNDDFGELKKEELSFINSDGNKISYFYYYFNDYKDNKLVLFLHGIGPGHTAYMSEINEICKRGYKVLTLDYTGCDKSEGKTLNSINQPTKDVDELLNLLNIKEEIYVIGHSLGGYTTLNTINIHENIKKAVVISGFFSLRKELKHLMKLNLLVFSAMRYENKRCNNYNKIDNLKFLKSTQDKILFIHSTDDAMVSYKSAMGYIKNKVDNPNLSFITEENKKHNPNYSLDAIKYMNNVFGEYQQKISSKELDTLEKKKDFMKDKSARKMTIQDQNIWDKIFTFLDK